MAKVFGLTITGIDKIALEFAVANKKLHEELKQSLFREGIKVQVEAQKILTEKEWTVRSETGYRRGYGRKTEFYELGETVIGHVVTGNLRRSIRTEAIVEESKLEVIIGTNVEYAPYVEALPDGGYLFPAYWKLKDEVIKNLQDTVMQVIKETRGR